MDVLTGLLVTKREEMRDEWDERKEDRERWGKEAAKWEKGS